MELPLESHLVQVVVRSAQPSRTIRKDDMMHPLETIAVQDLNDQEKQTVLMKELALCVYCQPRVKETQISFVLLIALLNQELIERKIIVKTD